MNQPTSVSSINRRTIYIPQVTGLIGSCIFCSHTATLLLAAVQLQSRHLSPSNNQVVYKILCALTEQWIIQFFPFVFISYNMWCVLCLCFCFCFSSASSVLSCIVFGAIYSRNVSQMLDLYLPYMHLINAQFMTARYALSSKRFVQQEKWRIADMWFQFMHFSDKIVSMHAIYL